MIPSKRRADYDLAFDKTLHKFHATVSAPVSDLKQPA